jgi:hypothetical protein
MNVTSGRITPKGNVGASPRESQLIAASACVLWFAYDKVHDRVFVVDEIYERGLLPETLALAVLEKDEQFGRELSGVIDSAAFAEVGLGTEGGKGSRGAIMNSLGCDWRPSEKGSGSRFQGISTIHSRLALKADGYGGLMITRNCRNLIRTLPSCVFSRTNPEDIDDSCEQHAVDCLRYGLTRRKMQFRLLKVTGL